MGIAYFPVPENQSIRVWFKTALDNALTAKMNEILIDAEKDQAEANKLTKFFTMLQKSAWKKKGQSAYEDVQDEYFGSLNIEAYLPRSVLQILFTKNKDERYTSYGNRFEEELAALLGNFMKIVLTQAGQKNIGDIDVFSGHTKANPLGYNDIVENMRLVIESEGFAAMEEAFGKDQALKFEGYITDNSGSFKNEKIDIDMSSLEGVFKEIELADLGMTPELEEVIRILSTATFTVKTSTRNEVHLGSTNLYKIYVANLTELGADASTINYSFLRAMICFNHHKQHDTDVISSVFSRMRQLYELTGFGLADFATPTGSFTDANRMAKFLLVSGTFGGGVTVSSTKYMLKEQLGNFSAMSKMKASLTASTGVVYK